MFHVDTDNPPVTGTPDMVQYVSESQIIGGGGGWAIGGDAILNLPNPSKSGNCLVVFLRLGGNWPITNFAIRDDQLNLWVKVAGTYNIAGDAIMHAFYALNVAASTREIRLTQVTSFTPFDAQWMGAEFYNVTAIDSTASNTGNSSTMTSGTITPTAGGDLIVFAGARVTSPTTTALTAGAQGSISWKLLGPNIFNGHSMQWGVYSAGSAFTPQMTMASSTQWCAMALAFKAGAQGSTRVAGIRTVGITTIDYRPGDFSTTQALQLSAYGNLRVISCIGGVAANAPTITNMSDNDGNTWAITSASVENDSRVNMWYGRNAAANSNSVVTITSNVSTGDYTAQCFDIIGAHATPYDVGGTATGTQVIAGNVTTVTLNPTTSNGICIGTLGVAFNTNTGIASPTGAYFHSSTYGGQSIDGPSTPDENNGWAIYYNPDTSALTFIFSEKDPTRAVGQWAAQAAAFKAA